MHSGAQPDGASTLLISHATRILQVAGWMGVAAEDALGNTDSQPETSGRRPDL